MYYFTVLMFMVGSFLLPTFSQAQSKNITNDAIIKEKLQQILQEAETLQLAERKEWKRLVHYKRNLFGGGWTSEADGLDFFLDPNGKTNPEAELNATLKGFLYPAVRRFQIKNLPQQTARCQYPARWTWLWTELKTLRESADILPSINQQDCEEFEKFRHRVSAQSVYLVFSGYDIRSPGSIFGHSLLRLSKTPPSDSNKPLATKGSLSSSHSQLLDWGINYASNPTTDNPFLYAINGLMGGFPGTFTGLPYYYKVREYNDYEARDLWEYELDLTPGEISHLVEHLWELGFTYFDYYYLSENCSYHMLTVLEAAAPQLNLLDKLPFYIIPSDTIRALVNEPHHIVKRFQFRPSIGSQFSHRYNRLSSDERKLFNLLIGIQAESSSQSEAVAKLEKSWISDKTSTDIAKTNALDSYIDYYDLKHPEQLITNPESEKKIKDKDDDQLWKSQLLTVRSQLPLAQPLRISINDNEAPHKSHNSTRVKLGAFHSSNMGAGVETELRFALHDLLDHPQGLPQQYEIEFTALKFRLWEQSKQFTLDQIRILSAANLSPWSDLEKPYSWRLLIGAERLNDFNCKNISCFSGFLKFGLGLSLPVLSHADKFLMSIYSLIDAESYGSQGFHQQWLSLKVGPSLGIRARLYPNWAWITEAQYRRGITPKQFDEKKLKNTIRYSPLTDLALEASLSFESFKNNREFLGSAYYFF